MKNKTVFLDRDGIINEQRIDHVKNIDEFKIFSGVGAVSYTHLTLPTNREV